MEQHNSTEHSLKNAFASARMEGLRITPQNERNCRRVLEGKISLEQYLVELKARTEKGL